MARNIWFNFASDRGGRPGISPIVNKMARFNQILPQIKAGKMHFPEELKKSEIMGEFVQELSLATVTGFKSRNDDCIDTISQLIYIRAYKPTQDTGMRVNEDGRWADDEDMFPNAGVSAMSSYIV